MINRLLAWLAAVGATYVLASAFATQSVIARLGEMGVGVPVGDRLAMTARDIAGMVSLFLPLVAATILIAFIVATIITHWLRDWRTFLFILAGAAGMIAFHLILQAALGMTPIAAARTTGGIAMQGVAGALGGWVFVLIARKRLLESD
jgi:formate hydrogenlyase subunit 4